MNSNKVLIVGGCFDVLHPGHLDFLSKAKKMCDYLIVLLEPDEKIRILKGTNRPINNSKLRIKNLEKTMLVDKIVLLPVLMTSEGYEKQISKIQFQISKQNSKFKILNSKFRFYFGVTKNDRNTKKNENIRNLGKKMNIKVVEVNTLLPEHSTSKSLMAKSK